MTYLYKYYHDGSWWTLEIPAESQADADERLKKLPHAQYCGELVAKVPASFGWLAKFYCWMKS